MSFLSLGGMQQVSPSFDFQPHRTSISCNMDLALSSMVLAAQKIPSKLDQNAGDSKDFLSISEQI
jgi:hypothetical protein